MALGQDVPAGLAANLSCHQPRRDAALVEWASAGLTLALTQRSADAASVLRRRGQISTAPCTGRTRENIQVITLMRREEGIAIGPTSPEMQPIRFACEAVAGGDTEVPTGADPTVAIDPEGSWVVICWAGHPSGIAEQIAQQKTVSLCWSQQGLVRIPPRRRTGVGDQIWIQVQDSPTITG